MTDLAGGRPATSVAEVLDAVRERALVRGGAPFLIALDGRSASGKSTLARSLALDLDAVVVEADDFFSGRSYAVWSARTARERADLCIDWRRLRREALEPLVAGRVARWHAFDWDTETDLSTATTELDPAGFVILDGVFSTRSELLDLLDYTVLVTADTGLRRARLHAREGDDYVDRWYRLWSEAETSYFSELRAESSFDAVVTSD